MRLHVREENQSTDLVIILKIKRAKGATRYSQMRRCGKSDLLKGRRPEVVRNEVNFVDRKLVEAPSDFIAGRRKAALLFCTSKLFCFHFFLARFIAVVPFVSVCIVYDLALWPSALQCQLPALLFVCALSYFLFVLCFIFVVRSCFVCEPKQNQGRGLVGRKLVQAPNNFIAGRPKAALLFWLFSDLRCGVPLFSVILVIYKYKNR